MDRAPDSPLPRREGSARARGRPLAAALVAAILLAPSVVRAAEQDAGLWTDLTLRHTLSDRVRLGLSVRLRMDRDFARVRDVRLKPFVELATTPTLTLALGYEHFETLPGELRHEERVWQSIEHRMQFSGLAIRNRLRLDQRFVEGVPGVVVRARYRLRATRPVLPPWYLAASEQLLFNLNDAGTGPVQGFEQSRLFAGAGLHLDRRSRLEFGYQWVYTRTRTADFSHHFLLASLVIRTH